MSKYFNNAIIGNSNILGCLTDKGELIRLYYPNIDYFQNIDKLKYGILGDNNINWFENSNTKKQYYEGNILYTELILNDIEIIQRDFVLPYKNVIVRKLKFNKKVNLFIYSKLNSDAHKKVSGMIINNALVQYSQDFYMASFSNMPISNYQINNSRYTLENGVLNPEDYIGMSEDSAIIYRDIEDITIYISYDSEFKKCIESINWCREQNENLLYENTKKYWDNYLQTYSKNSILKDLNKIKEKEIIERTIFMYALLSNPKTGAILASPDVDENFEKCGRYGYCWPRDGLFINRALNILGMRKLTDKFYNVWARKAQLDNGIFEQRYYSTGELAPSWGVQIDETASVLIGLYENGKWRKLEELVYKATIALLNFLTEEHISKKCFDLWEERKGHHLYSTASIYEGLRVANEMLIDINARKYKKLSSVILKELDNIKLAIKNNFIKDNKLVRSIDDELVDISLLSVVVPYKIFDPNEDIVKNTVELIENKLKLGNDGYLRYECDNYMGGNAWIISTLWLALYYIEIGNFERANELFNWVTEHADNLSFLPEQIEREGNKSAWVIQLSWSHAMYVIVKDKLMKCRGRTLGRPA